MEYIVAIQNGFAQVKSNFKLYIYIYIYRQREGMQGERQR